MSYSYFLLHFTTKKFKKKGLLFREITGGTEEVLAIESGIFLTLYSIERVPVRPRLSFFTV